MVQMSDEEWKKFKEKTGYQEHDQPPQQGPTRKDYEEKRESFKNDTGMQHGPDRSDYNRKKENERIEANKTRVEDEQSTKYWRNQKRESDSAARKEKEPPTRERDRPAKKTVYTDGKRRRRHPGVEIPRRGLQRFGLASRDAAEGSFSRLGQANVLSLEGSVNFGSGYSDPFRGLSLGGSSLFSGGGRSARNDPLNGLASMRGSPVRRGPNLSLTGSLTGGIFGGYRSPFSRQFSRPAPKRKPRKKGGKS